MCRYVRPFFLCTASRMCTEKVSLPSTSHIFFFFFQMATMDYAEIHVDQKYHRHIIGKGGASGKLQTCTMYDVCIRT